MIRNSNSRDLFVGSIVEELQDDSMKNRQTYLEVRRQDSATASLYRLLPPDGGHFQMKPAHLRLIHRQRCLTAANNQYMDIGSRVKRRMGLGVEQRIRAGRGRRSRSDGD